MNPRDKVFVKEFVRTGSPKAAAREAYSATVKPNGWSVTADRKLKQKHIQEMIFKAMKEKNITPEWVIDKRQQLVNKGMEMLGDMTKVQPSDIHQNLKVLEQLMGMYGEKTNGQNGNLHKHIHLHDKPRDEVIKKRQELVDYFDAIES